MKKILITGATGFIGSHVLPCLAANEEYEVHALSSRPVVPGDSRIRWHRVNLHAPEQVGNIFKEISPDTLLHLAWYTEHGKYWSSVKNLEWVQISLGMLRFFAEAGGKRAVFLGTCAEYDWRYGFCSERHTPRNPSSLYGVCKNALNMIAQSYAENFGIGYAWGRVFFPYGPGEAHTRFVSSIITSLLDKTEAKCTHGGQMRDFIYVKDLAAAIAALVMSDVTGSVNLGTGIPVRLKEIAKIIGDTIGRSEMLKFGAIPAPENDPPLVLADMTVFSRSTGWHPKYTLAEGIEETLEFWRKNEKK